MLGVANADEFEHSPVVESQSLEAHCGLSAHDDRFGNVDWQLEAPPSNVSQNSGGAPFPSSLQSVL
jgi:hypothetical protein